MALGIKGDMKGGRGGRVRERKKERKRATEMENCGRGSGAVESYPAMRANRHDVCVSKYFGLPSRAGMTPPPQRAAPRPQITPVQGAAGGGVVQPIHVHEQQQQERDGDRSKGRGARRGRMESK